MRLTRRLTIMILAMMAVAVAVVGEEPARAAEEPSIWVADEGGLVEVRRSDQAVLLDVSASDDARAVAVDRQLDLVWTVAGGALQALLPDGSSLVTIPLQMPAGEPVCLEIDEDDGSAWVGVGSKAWGYAYWGELQQELTFTEPILEMHVSPVDGRLWVVQAGQVVAIDRAEGSQVLSISDTGITSAAVHPVTGQLWVATLDDLVLFSPEGQEEQRFLHRGLRSLIAEGDGELWGLRGEAVVHLDEEGEITSSLSPFSLPQSPQRLRLDPATSTVWVASRRSLQRLSPSGWVQESLDLGAAANLRDLAPGRGERDEEGPILTLLAPADGSRTAQLRPEIQVSYADAGAGVDPESLFFEIDGAFLPTDCSYTPTGAICSPEQDLPAGAVRLTAWVSDFLDQASSGAEATFFVDPDEAGGGGSYGVENPPTGPDNGPSFYTAAPVDRGITANKIYVSDADIEAISTSTGNLTLSIPLSQVFTVGPSLSYQVRLHHNSSVWQEVKVPCSVAAPHRPLYCDGFLDNTYNIAVPNPNSNAGLGWELHFGKLYAPTPPAGLDALNAQRWPNRAAIEEDADATWLYVAPDGASHQFYGLSNRPAGADYTVDGSHLRLKTINSTTTHVEHPDGRVSVFRKTNDFQGTQFCGGGVNGCWRLQSVADPYGNSYSLHYPPINSNGKESWRLRDSTGRTHWVHFLVTAQWTGGGDGVEPYRTAHPADPTTPGRQDEWGDLRRSLSSVEIAAFGGQTLTWGAKYLNQTSATGTLVSRGRNSEPASSAPVTMTTRLLRAVVVEGGAIPAGQRFAYDFETHPSPAHVSGKIRKVTLPSHGEIAYEYGNWSFPTACVWRNQDYGQPDVPLRTYRFGVRKKTRKPAGAPAGSNKIGVWDYNSQLLADGPLVAQGPNCTRETVRRTVVDEPKRPGTGAPRTRRVFYTALTEGPREPRATDPIEEWQVTDHGLPYTKNEKVGTQASNYLFLSREVWSCPSGTPVGSTSGCGPQTKTYVRYAAEFNQGCYRILGNGPHCWQVNPVRTTERTLYADDGNRTRNVVFDELNGLGSFRKKTHWTSWGQQIEEETDYNSGKRQGSGGFEGLTIDSATGIINVEDPRTYYPPTGALWVLHEARFRKLKDGGNTYRTDFEYDGKGSIVCQRRRKNFASMSQHDIVTRYTLGTTSGVNKGLVTLEEHAGGDTGNLSTTSVCSVVGNRNNGSYYLVDHTYDSLQRTTSRVRSGGGESFPYLYRAAIDTNTGLPSVEYTISDQSRQLFYDELGRLTSVVPESSLREATTLLDHRNPISGNANVTIRRRVGDTTLTTEKIIFDDLGRPRQREVNRPRHQGATPVGGFSTSKSETDYFGSGVERYTTTLHDVGAPATATEKRTETLRYDPFGMATEVKSPYGHLTQHTYSGDRKRETQTWVATAANGSDALLAGQTAQTHVSFFDTVGRTVQETTPQWTMLYTYDPYGNVLTAKRGSQTRTYTYDGRGFLTREQLPELGASGAATGTIDYTRDVMGGVRTKSGSGWHLSYDYDQAFRLTEVKDAANQTWAEYAYGISNNTAAGNYAKGKLTRAARYNRPLGGVWVVAELYGYKGNLGQLSSRTTRLEFPAETPERIGDTFSQSWLYDELGQVTREVYPSCDSTECSDGPGDRIAPEHRVDRTWVQGIPTKTSSSLGISGEYTYHDNLQMRTARYNNGTSMEFTRGRNGMVLPTRLRMLSNNRQETKWDTGIYRYDGVLNVRKIGADLFSYDGNSRLKSGTVRARWDRFGTVFTNHSESYTYDQHGNVLTRRRDGGTTVSYTYQQSGFQMKNRLLHTLGHTGSPDIVYDTRGNVTKMGRVGAYFHQEMGYDPMGMQSEHREFRADGSSTENLYLYGPGNLRFLTATREISPSGQGGAIHREYDLRNGGKVIRRWKVDGWGPGQDMRHDKDYIYDPKGLVATASTVADPSRKYFFQDHLGTTRVITNQHGITTGGYHSYYPYGEEIQHPLTTVNDRMSQFTGHEREAHGQADYMLGRHCSYRDMRFLSVDPGRDGWNLYAYAAGNPVKFVDSSGRYHGPPSNSSRQIPSDYEAKARIRRENSEYTQVERELDSVSLGFVPVVGDIKDAQEAVTGVDLVTGDKLSTGQRVVAGVAAAAPIVSGKALREIGEAIVKGGREAGSSAGNIKVFKTSQLKRRGIDAEAVKADILNDRIGGRYNIGVDNSGNVALVPVEKGAGEVIRTDIPFETLLH